MSCNYIYIFKGDDTNWNNEQFLTVNVTGESGVDLSTMTATFRLGSIVKNNISLASGTFQISLSAQDTAGLVEGSLFGSIQIFDEQGRVKTACNTIPFYITNQVIVEQNQQIDIELPQGSPVTINLSVGGTVSYNNLTDKPSINGVTISGAQDASYYDLATKTALDAHIADIDNPHEVTKAQVGLENVDNTSDLNKPISTATQTALNGKVNKSGDTMTGPLSFGDFSISSEDGMAKIEGTQYGLRVDTTSGLGAALLTANGLGDVLTSLNVQSTYSATGMDPVNGTAVASAISTKQDTLSSSQLDAVNSGIDSTKVGQIATNTQNISNEVTNRQNADIALQGQIDALSAASDVTDIVGTYADLQAYDTTKLKDNDIIKVLTDSTHDNASSYYRWSTHTDTFTYIGSEGPYVTPAQLQSDLDTKQDVITGAATTITSNNLTASMALVSGSNGKVAVSSVTSTELGYVSGVTSSIQTQLGNKLDSTTAANTYATQSALSSGLAGKASSADGSTIIDNGSSISTVAVKEQRNSTAIKQWVGTTAQLPGTKDSDTIYIVTDEDDSAFLTVDSSLSPTSENPVQNKVIYQALQDVLPSQTGNSGKFLTTNGTTTSWATVSGGGSVPTLTWYTGNTGNTVTIADTTGAALVKIYKNGILLEPTADYSVSGTTLTLVTALESTDKITTEVF